MKQSSATSRTCASTLHTPISFSSTQNAPTNETAFRIRADTTKSSSSLRPPPVVIVIVAHKDWTCVKAAEPHRSIAGNNGKKTNCVGR